MSTLASSGSSGSYDNGYDRYVDACDSVLNRPGSRMGTSEIFDEERIARLVGNRPSAVLLIRDLPALLFEADADLAPLFWPYGEVKRLERLRVSSTLPKVAAMEASTTPAGTLTQDSATFSILSSSPSGTPSFNAPGSLNNSVSSLNSSRNEPMEANPKPASTNGTSPYVGICTISEPAAVVSKDTLSPRMSVLVEYATIASACEARQSLQGQIYGTHTISVDFVELSSQPGVTSSRISPGWDNGVYGSSFGSSPIGAVTSGAPGFGSSLLGTREHNRSPFKRHSMAGPSPGPLLDVTPSSPPQSARSFGGLYDRERERAYERRYANHLERDLSGHHDELYGRQRLSHCDPLGGGVEWEHERELARRMEWEREREFAVRRAMYDRSNNTSPFPGRRGMLAPNPGIAYATPAFTGSDGLGGVGGTFARPLGCGDIENRFGAIARPLSSQARLPPDVPASAVPKSKFDELR
jgi:hypothetical protein